MNVRFYIDPETGLPHIHGHTVDEDEVEDVLRQPGEDRPGREGFPCCDRPDEGEAVYPSYLCPRSRTRFGVRHYGLSVDRQGVVGIPAPPKEKIMKQSKFPPRWDEARVRRVLAHYEEQSEEEAVAEDEAAVEDKTQTVMEIPSELVPAVRELIAKRRAS